MVRGRVFPRSFQITFRVSSVRYFLHTETPNPLAQWRKARNPVNERFDLRLHLLFLCGISHFYLECGASNRLEVDHVNFKCEVESMH